MNSISAVLSENSFWAIILSFCIGWLLIPITIRIAKQKNLVAKPNGRTSHSGNVPNVGGVNIFLAYFVAAIVFAVPVVKDVYVFSGMFFILLIGLFDDVLYTEPRTKLIGELFSGILLIVFAHVRFTHLHGFWGITILSSFFSYILTFFIFILLVNAINLIDGIDGLASGLGIIYSLFYGIYFYLIGQQGLAVIAFSLLGSLIIFFIYNVYGIKGKIFMGDCGSLLLGYLFSYFTIEFCELNAYNSVPVQYHFYAAPAVAILVLIVPLFDTIRVFITRIKRGKSPFHADKNHIHHLMLKLGLKHKQISFILMGINTLFVILGIIGRNWNMHFLILLALVITILLIYFVWLKVNRIKF